MRGRLAAGTLLGALGVLALAMAAPAGAAAATNGLIAYDSAGNVFTMSPDGSGRTKLTSSGGNTAPSFSPNGRRIVFSHKVRSDYEIVVMNADGSGKRVLTKGASDFQPSFSPDGKRIAFSRALHTPQYDHSEIFVMRSNGSHLKRLTRQPPAEQARNGYPVFSPNGRWIAYESITGEELDVEVVHPDGTHGRLVYGNGFGPCFTLDGRQLLFAEGFSQFSQLGLVKLNGSDAHDFTSNSDANFNFDHPRYSPDGARIVVTGQTYSSTPPPVGSVSDDVYVMNADGTGMTQITHDGTSQNASWGQAAGTATR